MFAAAKTVKNLWIGYYQNETVWNEEEIKKAKVSCTHNESNNVFLIIQVSCFLPTALVTIGAH